MSKEIEYRHIPNYHGYMATSDGRICNTRHFLSQSPDGRGYLKVKIAGKTKTVHRLVLMAFNGIPEKGMVCNHKNGNRTDNRIENLEWCTQSENMRHSLKTNKPNNMKPILDTNTGVYYESIREVCKLYGIKVTTFIMRLKGKNRNKIPFIYA